MENWNPFRKKNKLTMEECEKYIIINTETLEDEIIVRPLFPNGNNINSNKESTNNSIKTE